MNSLKPFLGEDDSVNRPSCFTGEYNYFWKIRMQMFLELKGVKVWKSVKNGPYIPTLVINGVSFAKPKDT